MEHEVREIPGYEKYSVDKTGVVYGRYKRPVKPRIRANGQVCVDLYTKDGGRISVGVARCVALAFLGPPDGRQAMHKDGDKDRNILDNIKWASRQEIMQSASKRGVLSGKRTKRKEVAENAAG